MSPGSRLSGSAHPGRDKSRRASAPCARCEAEQQDLYTLPGPDRISRYRFDVCAFCYLKITRNRPGLLSLLD